MNCLQTVQSRLGLSLCKYKWRFRNGGTTRKNSSSSSSSVHTWRIDCRVNMNCRVHRVSNIKLLKEKSSNRRTGYEANRCSTLHTKTFASKNNAQPHLQVRIHTLLTCDFGTYVVDVVIDDESSNMNNMNS
ncbi:hypothetical protein C0J52_05897 [Blattella germanica]|nr:hypothetical protein C0J52_05897 [Blattella germanica]